jgi:hypothetical protein
VFSVSNNAFFVVVGVGVDPFSRRLPTQHCRDIPRHFFSLREAVACVRLFSQIVALVRRDCVNLYHSSIFTCLNRIHSFLTVSGTFFCSSHHLRISPLVRFSS